jgi:hypothetical protein
VNIVNGRSGLFRCKIVEPKMRIELTTYALRVRCSTPELPGRVDLEFIRHKQMLGQVASSMGSTPLAQHR